MKRIKRIGKKEMEKRWGRREKDNKEIMIKRER